MAGRAGDPDVQDQQGDGDGEDAVAEGLQPPGPEPPAPRPRPLLRRLLRLRFRRSFARRLLIAHRPTVILSALPPDTSLRGTPKWHGCTTCLTRRVPTVSNPAQLSGSDDPWDAPDPALALALQQLSWYRAHRNRARMSYGAIELLLLVMTATTTVAAALKATAWVTAV